MSRRRIIVGASLAAAFIVGIAIIDQAPKVDQRIVVPASSGVAELAARPSVSPTASSPIAAFPAPLRTVEPTVPPAEPEVQPSATIPPVPTGRPVADTPKAEVKSVAKAPSASPKSTSAKKPSYKGKNMFWYPALGIKASIKGYGCQYGGNPKGIGRGLYTWGCSGKNNTYLLAHAYSTFHPIQIGYHTGRLKKGGLVYYADAKGKVTRYKVAWIKRIPLKTWKTSQFGYFAAMDRKTLTLQTCDGSRSQYRIVVRLYPG